MKRRGMALGAVCALALAVAACGGDSDGDSAESTEPVAESTEAPGSDSTPAAGFGEYTVGIVYLSKANEYSVRAADAYMQAFDFLGWNFVEIDAQGDPAAAETAMQSLIAQGVDVILDASWEPQPIAQSLQDAQAADIPVIVVFGAVTEDPGFAGQLVTADAELAEPLVERFFADLPQGAKIAKINSTQFGWGQIRDQVFAEGLAARPDVEVVAEHQIDYANLQADTLAATEDILNAHPDLAGIWNDVSITAPAITEVLANRDLCDGDGGFVFVSFIGDLPNNEAIRTGCTTALADPPIIAQSWVVADVIVDHLLGGVDIPASLPDYEGLDYKKITLIDSTNVPADTNQYFELSDAGVGVDYVEYFTSRWTEKYGS